MNEILNISKFLILLTIQAMIVLKSKQNNCQLNILRNTHTHTHAHKHTQHIY